MFAVRFCLSILLFLVFQWNTSALHGQEFLGLEVELIANSEAGTTYHVYAAFDDPACWVKNVFAEDAAQPLLLQPQNGAVIYQTPTFGADLGQNINPAFFSFMPELEFDSWFTIGSANSTGYGGVSLLEMEGALANFNAGQGFEVSQGTWYVQIGGEPAPDWTAGEDLRVLLVQITLTNDSEGNQGHFDLQLSLRWEADGSEHLESLPALNSEVELYGGCTDIDACNYDASALVDDGTCEYVTCSGCTDSAACTFDPEAIIDNGSCVYPDPATCIICEGDSWAVLDADGDGICDGNEVAGCLDPTACNYQEFATDLVPCEFGPCPGCTDEAACNFEAIAEIDDGSCEYFTCALVGCTNPLACNYAPSAQFESGECSYPEPGYDCDGTCSSDADGDGVCDANELVGCTLEDACNYNSQATDDDGSCAFPVVDECGCGYDCNGQLLNDTDGDGVCDGYEIVACNDPEACDYSPTTCLNVAFSCSYPATGYDCEGTCLQDADGDGVCDENEIYGCTDPEAVCCTFNPEATEDDGSCIYIAGPYDCDVICCESDIDGDGVCDEFEVLGCMDPFALDYDESATDWALCSYPVPSTWLVTPTPASAMVIGTVTLDGAPADPLDALGLFTPAGVCAGTAQVIFNNGSAYMAVTGYGDDGTTADLVEGFAEGEAMELRLWDASAQAAYTYVNPLGVPVLGLWSNMNGAPLPAYAIAEVEYAFVTSADLAQCNDPAACNYEAEDASDVNCIYPPAGQNCFGECLLDSDQDGVCDPDEISGCTDEAACNFNPSATDDDGSCAEFDACGVCGGPGAVDDCGCDPIPDGACDCDGNFLDALGVCGGDCTADLDGDGICDDVDDCVGELDACGVCNGPGAIYSCGCFDQPAGDCDCSGNTVDALGECGGDCAADADGDGVCDDVDECVGEFDACGVCNGPGAVYACGCADLAPDACDCDGNVLDALGVCGGPCAADADGDGVCDDEDDCVGELDSCGVCNGPGAVYDCGCFDIPEGECDCEGNVADAIGACGGDCPADMDGDGVCDDAEVWGCDDPEACNFSCDATENDGSCAYAAVYLDCNGNCLVDTDGDGICEQDEIPGCTDSTACNYDAAATDAMNTYCAYPDLGRDCAGNCLEDADLDGVCDADELPGCTDENAVNFNPYATETALLECIYGSSDCPADVTGDDYVGTADLLVILSFYGENCPPD